LCVLLHILRAESDLVLDASSELVASSFKMRGSSSTTRRIGARQTI
jgi:hypothetical protein